MKGKISIFRSHGGGHDDRIHISITEENSRVEFFDGFMSCEEFGKVVTGLSHQPIEFEFRPEKVGMIAENKFELVPKPKDYRNKEEAKELLKPFEVDGWKGHIDDMFNIHCRAGDKQRVRFFRHVPA